MSRPLKYLGLFAAVAMVAVSALSCEKSRAGGKKVFVLGCDGMDPKLVRRLIDEGRMPNFAKLEDQGGFRPLTTSIPPQSPVAWSNFITGAGPGVHGIFDFIHRDPTRQAFPYFSTSIDSPGEKPWLSVPIGSYQFSTSDLNPWADKGGVELARRGKPFWDYLDEAGIPVQMYRLPANYPPSESTHGHMCCLSGMGTPDALGGQGTYQHFSTKPRRESKGGDGMRLRMRKDFKTGAYVAILNGPANEFKVPSKRSSTAPAMTVRINVYPDPENEVAKLVYANEAPMGLPDETVELILNTGEWSEWSEVHFLKTPVGPSFGTMVRFRLQRVRPYVELYVSPLNFIPTAPEAVFSEPPELADDIGRAIGPYHTQGFAEEFNALKNGIFTDAEYSEQAAFVLKERFRLLDYALDRFEEGLLFFYFSSSDLQAHMFWWDSDEPHPTRSARDSMKYQAVLENVYVQIDRALGKCIETLGDETTIIVMSDHGFCNFRRQVNVNNFLRDEGYLDAPDGGVLACSVYQWSRTKAYAMGLNGLYLNLSGREKFGVVDPAVRDKLLDEISEKLLAIRDPENDRQVIKRVYRTDEWYSGPETKNAPDLIIGFEREYRASWISVLGGFDKDGTITDNKNAWSADHCIAHDVVPGVVLSNRRIAVDDPALIDVAPTVLAEFAIPRPGSMTGKSFFEAPPGAIAQR